MAQRTNFRGMACSIAKTWSVVGEPWTPLVLRDLAIGIHRFDELKADLGIAPNILTERLRVLEADGVVERQPYSDGGRQRHEYHLTEAGKEFVPVLIAITNWGDKWLTESGPPALFSHSLCSSRSVAGVVVCSECGEPLTAENTRAVPGPGATPGPGTLRIGLAG